MLYKIKSKVIKKHINNYVMKMMSTAISAIQIRKICRLSKYILYVFILNRYNFGIEFNSVLFILYSRISIILQYII